MDAPLYYQWARDPVPVPFNFAPYLSKTLLLPGDDAKDASKKDASKKRLSKKMPAKRMPTKEVPTKKVPTKKALSRKGPAGRVQD